MGVGIIRLGDVCTGHEDWPPRPVITSASTVYVEGILACCEGDQLAVHCNRKPECHDGVIAAGSGMTFVEGRKLARHGDPVSCGGTMVSSTSSTNCG